MQNQNWFFANSLSVTFFIKLETQWQLIDLTQSQQEHILQLKSQLSSSRMLKDPNCSRVTCGRFKRRYSASLARCAFDVGLLQRPRGRHRYWGCRTTAAEEDRSLLLWWGWRLLLPTSSSSAKEETIVKMRAAGGSLYLFSLGTASLRDWVVRDITCPKAKSHLLVIFESSTGHH